MNYLLALTLLLAGGLWLGPVSWLSPETHDFGDIERDQPVRVDFRFRNTSGAPLLIDNVRTACGCTVPNWSQAAIPPDSIGTITVDYDARDTGYFRKYLKIYFHGQRRPEKRWIEGYVLGGDEPD